MVMFAQSKHAYGLGVRVCLNLKTLAELHELLFKTAQWLFQTRSLVVIAL